MDYCTGIAVVLCVLWGLYNVMEHLSKQDAIRQKAEAAARKAQEEANLLATNPEAWRALKEHERKEKEQKILEEELKKQTAHDRAAAWTRLGVWWWKNG